ncbi:Zn(II)2Cys6 transcription factor [Aspergillus stella-maris]|uniref:Zn(II)2Cys6 transcription factor n=1 Tax=Aspergillus stella-maris TaxID=1810926 RepID=UPI003CCE2F18
MSSPPKKEPNARSRRAARACARCHSRKVRCDGSITGFPCTNCRLDGRSCTLHSGKRDKEKQMLRAIVKERDIQTTAYPTPTPSTGSTELHPKPNLTFVKSQMALRVPIQVLDVFTKHYFLYVHPCLPVVDETVFWRKYRSVDASAGKISTLLFQAMLFAASSFVPIEAAKECGYDSLITAREDLYRRAKRLYESGIEKDRLVISQACLLLTYYTTDAERSSNSRWLRIAIRYAKKERAHLYGQLPEGPTGLGIGRNTSDLKRLWWCCMIRDRIISLGMRRPIQITPDDFDHHQSGLSFQDLEEECLNSEVYPPEAKVALCRVLASLCHLVVAVTDVIMLVYPTTQSMPFSLADRRAQLNRLEGTKFALLDWELTWVANPDGKEYYIHPSMTLYTNLCAIYFQSARIALCNRICLMIGYNAHLTDDSDMYRIESCRAELATAIRSTADNVKQLIQHGVADKLPISAVAYTLLPQILLSIQTQLSTTPEDKQLHEVMLLFFTELSRFLRSQYYIRLIIAVSWKALELCRPKSSRSLLRQPPDMKALSDSTSKSIISSGNTNTSDDLVLKPPFFADLNADELYCYPNLFQLKFTEYVRLLKYVDEFMSLRRAPGEDVIYAAPTAKGPLYTRGRARTLSQSSTLSSGSLRKALTAPTAPSAPAATTREQLDTNTALSLSADGETSVDPSSPRWTEDYFWVYFGERELEGYIPATVPTINAATTTSDKSNNDSSAQPDKLNTQESSLSSTSVSPPDSTHTKEEKGKGKETCHSAARQDTFQNMLDCLPLLGE